MFNWDFLSCPLPHDRDFLYKNVTYILAEVEKKFSSDFEECFVMHLPPNPITQVPE